MLGVSPAAVQSIQSTEDTCIGDSGKSRPIYDQFIAVVTWTQVKLCFISFQYHEIL